MKPVDAQHPAARLQSVDRALVAGLWLAKDPWELARAAVADFLDLRETLTVVAAHVTSLNATRDPDFVHAFNEADGAHADGISWVLVASAGGQSVHKVATTDLAPAMIRLMADGLGRPVRLAVLGGEPSAQPSLSLAARAGAALERDLPVDLVHAGHGFHQSWEAELRAVRGCQPDLVLVGLGMPREAVWAREHRRELPPALVVTCGGWLRLLAGEEDRAPQVARRWNLEWAHRLVTDPRRTAQRYAVGAGYLVYRILEAAASRAHLAATRIPETRA